ncbi:uncharacterized protein LOC108740985 [Agrilus planipennis]|uniref:Uncharacterized protein LOC108740985 n=1 Tax=Agrilus planipennis TaxID=224129 RepID=A0A1W4X4N4_AGRPL|nr:uncharacterized protein LOC108740985 [Agrilus planipennis]
MASSDKESFEMEDNLIDLNVTSPQFPRCTKFYAVSSQDSDNLMDTDLPVLEHKLQKTLEPPSGSPTGEIVNVEDILISLEGSDNSSCAASKDKQGLEKDRGDILMEILTATDEETSPISPVSCEALNILSKLDEILNESLRSSEELLQQHDDPDVIETEGNCEIEHPEASSSIQQNLISNQQNEVLEKRRSRSSSTSSNSNNIKSISNPLTELDATLGTYSTDEVRTCNDNETELEDERRSRTADDVSLSLSYEDVETLSLKTESNSEETETMATGESCNGDLEAEPHEEEPRLRNYCTGGDSPILKSEIVPQSVSECKRTVEGDNGVNLKRAVSNSGGDRGGNFKRNNRWRATMGSTNDVKPIIHNASGELLAPCERISVPGVESDEEIDWSWVHDVEIERRAHATGDYGTGSVIVEPVQREAAPEPSSNDRERNEDDREVVTEENCNEEARQRQESGWQRSSMRRIQHLRLPSDLTRIDIPETPEVASAPPAETEQFQLNNLQNLQGSIENTHSTRPVSAPSRLGTHSSVATQSSVRETRSRSRDSRSRSNVPETVYRNRARSSSASSRSRRLRSLSSSESSLASSIESAPTAETQQGQPIGVRSWIAASQEVFLTWGLLGASAMQIASHNKNKHLLQRDSSLIAMITFTILLLAAFLANTCVQLLHSFGYRYLPDSFEKISSYGFLRATKDPLPANLANTPVRYMFHQSFIVGERVTRPGTDHTSESGYQALRFATELLPTTFAIIGPNQLSPFWAVLFYFTMIFFGITQQLAIWHCVITGIMAIKTKILRSWETTITFFSCACGFVLGLPMATELGIYVIYFLDFTVGGQWWMMLIILIQILAVFMVRGRPYSGDALVNALFTNPSRPCVLSWAPALLSFTWNVILPVALMVWCIIFFKNGNFRELFIWHHVASLEYWPLWARQLGSMLQLLHVLCVPLVAVIQSYRYLNKGPDDILDRVQLLYRPPIGEHMENFTVQENPSVTLTSAAPPNQISTTITEDPPPKYTPPPSYTTATGARIAKFFRQSIRRSIRRIANVMGESSRSANRQIERNTTTLPPPDYNAVLDEINHSRTSATISVNVIDLPENENQRNGTTRSETGVVNLQPGVALSAADVACILRNSFRRSARRAMNIFRRDPSETRESISAENLVESVAPIGQTSVNLESFSNDGHEVKPAFQNPSTVI